MTEHKRLYESFGIIHFLQRFLSKFWIEVVFFNIQLFFQDNCHLLYGFPIMFLRPSSGEYDQNILSHFCVWTPSLIQIFSDSVFFQVLQILSIYVQVKFLSFFFNTAVFSYAFLYRISQEHCCLEFVFRWRIVVFV